MESARGSGGVWTFGGVRTAGLLCAAGGAGWLASGLVLVASGPLDGAGFVVSQAIWFLVQTFLLVGVLGLAFSGAASGWLGALALGVALLGRADFVAAEVHSLVIGEESILLPLGAMITAVGMTLVGVAVLRAKVWKGWRKFTPLVAGVYPFVAMFPFIFVSNEPNMLSIAVWGIPWIALGCAIYSEDTHEHDPSNQT